MGAGITIPLRQGIRRRPAEIQVAQATATETATILIIITTIITIITITIPLLNREASSFGDWAPTPASGGIVAVGRKMINGSGLRVRVVVSSQSAWSD